MRERVVGLAKLATVRVKFLKRGKKKKEEREERGVAVVCEEGRKEKESEG